MFKCIKIFPEVVEYDDVTILFCDIKSWTSISVLADLKDSINFLRHYYEIIFKLVKKYNCQQYETAGDGYVICFNVLKKDINHASTAIKVAEEIIRQISELKIPILNSNEHTKIRIGIHTGKISAGYVLKNKFQIAGDTINIASRMETTAIPGCIHISKQTYQHLNNDQKNRCKKIITKVKGRGIMVTYYINVNNENNYNNIKYSEFSIENRHAISFVNNIENNSPLDFLHNKTNKYHELKNYFRKSINE